MHSLFKKAPRDFFFLRVYFLTLCVRTWLLELAKCFGLTQNQAVKRREQHQCDAITYLRVTSGRVLKQRAKPPQLDLTARSCSWNVRWGHGGSETRFKVNLLLANPRQGAFKSFSSWYRCDCIYFRAG